MKVQSEREECLAWLPSSHTGKKKRRRKEKESLLKIF